jgi:hypothetical protein
MPVADFSKTALGYAPSNDGTARSGELLVS